jgi:hypothetical protein
LTKHIADCHQARTPAQHEHAERLAQALRYEPCSPTCANWSGKTLADHQADWRHWLTMTLGLPEIDPARYSWEPVTPGDPDHMPNTQRLLHVVAARQRWHAALTEARARASGQSDLSAIGEAA